MFELYDFRRKLGISDNYYKRMGQFKEKVLDFAVKQINEHSDIILSYEQHKQGRRITGFVFKFKYKEKTKKNAIERDPDTLDMFTGATDKELKPLNAKTADMFGNLLGFDDNFGSKYARVGESKPAFVARIKRELQTVEGVIRYADELKKVGYKSYK